MQVLSAARSGGWRLGVFILLPLCILIASTISTLAQDGMESQVITVAIVHDGDSWLLDETSELIEREVGVLQRGGVDFVFKSSPAFEGDFTRAGAAGALDAALNDLEVDIVIASGLLTIDAAIQYRGDLPKPVLGTALQGADILSGVVNSQGFSIKPNLALTLAENTVESDLKAFQRLVSFKRVDMLVNSKVVDTVENSSAIIAALEQALSIEIFLHTYQPTAEATLAQLPAEAEAVYLFAPFVMSLAEIDELIAGFNAARLPTFAFFGRPGVERGVFAAAMPEISEQLARRTALNLVNISNGTSPNAIRSFFPIVPQLVINGATAERIGIPLDLNALMDAEVLEQDRHRGRLGQPLAFIQAVTLALQNNFQLQAQRESTEISRLGQRVATSPLLPQAGVAYDYSRIDDDSASSGFFPRDSHAVGVTINQVIYNNDLWSNRSISKRLFEQATFEEQTVQFDVVRNVASAYLFLLSNLALEKIAKDNLARTRENLELARIRRRVGSTGPEDVLRFESQEAGDQSALVDASAQVEISTTSLNRLLGVELQSVWEPEELDLESPSFEVTADRLVALIESQRRFDAFVDFSRQQSLEQSPEILAFEQAIEAQTINVDRIRRNFFLPSVGAGFNYTYNIDQNFTGVFPGQGNDDQWSLGVTASLPIFEGAQRIHILNQEKAGLRNLEFQRSLLNQQIEERTLNSLDQLTASYPTLRFSRTAEEKAQRNLEVVTDKYKEGAVSIIDLLDAQNQFLVAQQNATVSLFRFLNDLVTYQRAIGWFEILKEPDEKAEWLGDLSDTLNQATP